MNREAFLQKKFHAATLAVIEYANELIAEYELGGFAEIFSGNNKARSGTDTAAKDSAVVASLTLDSPAVAP